MNLKSARTRSRVIIFPRAFLSLMPRKGSKGLKAMEDNYKKERTKELQRREVESRKQAERLAKQNGGKEKAKHP